MDPPVNNLFDYSEVVTFGVERGTSGSIALSIALNSVENQHISTKGYTGTLHEARTRYFEFENFDP